MRVTTSSCATGTIEPVIRGVFGVFPAATAAAAAAPDVGLDADAVASSPSVLSTISATVVPDAAAEAAVVEVDEDGVGVAGGSMIRLGSIMHGGSSFRPSSLNLT